MADNVNKPKHYRMHPSGIECIQITEHMKFNLGNAMKYIWRSDLKDAKVEDLQKAIWYLNREINRIEGQDYNRNREEGSRLYKPMWENKTEETKYE
jgi:Ribonuclease G/E